MEQIITQTKTIFIGESGEGMRRITEFFLGDDSHWTDKAWVYGYVTVAIAICTFIYFQTN